MVDLRPLKKILEKDFPEHILTKVLEVEPDSLSDAEFLVKMLTYLKLAHKGGDHGHTEDLR